MPITFDTLDELKAFYRSFKLDEHAPRATAAAVRLPEPEAEEMEAPKRRGRPPGFKPSVMPKSEPAKRGRKPGSVAKTASEGKAAKPKRDKSGTLTARIQAAVQKHLDDSRSFTANDVYDELSKRDASINKQSVITSVLKQMNTTFSDVSVTERPGNGPRPVKLYNAS